MAVIAIGAAVSTQLLAGEESMKKCWPEEEGASRLPEEAARPAGAATRPAREEAKSAREATRPARAAILPAAWSSAVRRRRGEAAAAQVGRLAPNAVSVYTPATLHSLALTLQLDLRLE